MNLRWAHSQQNPVIFTDGISPKMGKHCDFGHIIDPQLYLIQNISPLNISNNLTLFELDLEVLPYTYSHMLPPGEYQVELKIAASNCSPITKKFKINHTGIWFANEVDMFTKGIGIKEILN